MGDTSTGPPETRMETGFCVQWLLTKSGVAHFGRLAM
jgi:hypothetical protein